MRIHKNNEDELQRHLWQLYALRYAFCKWRLETSNISRVARRSNINTSLSQD